MASRYFHAGYYIACRSWKYYNIGRTPIDRGVVFIEHQVVGRVEDIFGSKGSTEFTHHCCFFFSCQTLIQRSNCWWRQLRDTHNRPFWNPPSFEAGEERKLPAGRNPLREHVFVGTCKPWPIAAPLVNARVIRPFAMAYPA